MKYFRIDGRPYFPDSSENPESKSGGAGTLHCNGPAFKECSIIRMDFRVGDSLGGVVVNIRPGQDNSSALRIDGKDCNVTALGAHLSSRDISFFQQYRYFPVICLYQCSSAKRAFHQNMIGAKNKINRLRFLIHPRLSPCLHQSLAAV